MRAPALPLEDDTIAAISTPYGVGGIGIVRLSGKDAEKVGRKLFLPRHPRKTFLSHHMYYGHIQDPQNARLVDEVLVCFMRSPHTYTREDMVEIQCHGGHVPTQKILELAFVEGVRPAGPGEFTRRAFMNGRIDLVQAEAVVDTVNAASHTALRFAQRQLDGTLSREIQALHGDVKELVVEVEAWLDFPEEDLDGPDFDRIVKELERLHLSLGSLADTYKEGRVYRDGVTLVIGGLPNVGKSTLLNVLVRKDRAIVSPEPGTTRDFLEESLSLSGIPVRMIDTAGLRDVEDQTEARGVELAEQQIKAADLFLFVIDASELNESVCTWVEQKALEGRTLLVLNKMDLIDEEILNREVRMLPDLPGVRISALNRQGIDQLKEKIACLLTGEAMALDSRAVVTNLRHHQALEGSRESLARAHEQMLSGSWAGDLLAADLRHALRALGDILGETTPDEILETIFNRFCIGK